MMRTTPDRHESSMGQMPSIPPWLASLAQASTSRSPSGSAARCVSTRPMCVASRLYTPWNPKMRGVLR